MTGPGSGNPVAVNASASDSAANPAAVKPASSATPRSTGHTVVRRADAVTITRPAYCPSLRLPAGGPPRGDLPLDELLSRDHVQPVRVAEDPAQFPQNASRRSLRSGPGSRRCWSAATCQRSRTAVRTPIRRCGPGAARRTGARRRAPAWSAPPRRSRRGLTHTSATIS